MSAVAGALDRAWRSGAFAAAGAGQWWPPAGLLVGLSTVIAARSLATRLGLDALAVGLAFGMALGALTLVGRRGRSWLAERSPGAASGLFLAAFAGVTFGVVLVALVVLGAWLGGSAGIAGLARPAAPFLPWAAITLLVATTEEALVRGRLFDAARRAGGPAAALAITTVAFALMHVPLYGWGVVPLDLAVGLGLGGLRLVTGRVTAPAVAHAVADLATWWL